jgi:phage baseplate assembly protein W
MADPINIKYPLRRGSRGAFEINEDTFDAILDDLKLLILTNHGERPVHFDFGANLRPLIFEFRGSDLRQVINDSVLAAIEKWMPFVNVVSLSVDDETTDTTLHPNQIHLTLEFSVGNIDVTKILKQRISA